MSRSPFGRLVASARSVRFQLAMLVTTALVVTAGVLVLGMNLALDTVAATIPAAQPTSLEDELLRILGMSLAELDGSGDAGATDALLSVEQAVREQTLQQVRNLSAAALAVLVPVGLAIGWVVAGRVVRPVRTIANVARDIEATDLSRRIHLGGPADELRDLADTFDSMLDRLDRGVRTQRQFVEDASHELRNPLAVIRTTLDVALSEPEDAEGLRQAAEVAQRTADRMSTTVDELLAFARTSVQPERRVPVDLAEVVADIAQEYDAVASNRGIRLSRLAPSGLVVDGDRSALKRAQANLVSNALRAAPPGSVVHCRAGRIGGWLWFGVRDVGRGIAPEIRRSSFAAPGATAHSRRKVTDRAWDLPSFARSPRHMAARSAWPRSLGTAQASSCGCRTDGRVRTRCRPPSSARWSTRCGRWTPHRRFKSSALYIVLIPSERPRYRPIPSLPVTGGIGFGPSRIRPHPIRRPPHVDDPFAGDERQHKSWRDLPPTPPLVWSTTAPAFATASVGAAAAPVPTTGSLRRPRRRLVIGTGLLVGAFALVGTGMLVAGNQLGAMLPSLAAARAQGAPDDEAAAVPPSDEPLADTASRLLPSVVQIEAGSGVGSGFVAADGGLILTASHVVGRADTVTLRLHDGTSVSGAVVAVSNTYESRPAGRGTYCSPMVGILYTATYDNRCVPLWGPSLRPCGTLHAPAGQIQPVALSVVELQTGSGRY